jgi:hypothetical protein
VLVTALPAVAKTYPPSGPNDPNYAPMERATFPVSCQQHNANDEQHYLYSFEPACTPNAHDPSNAAGMSVDKAWSTYTIGDPHIVMAYVEAGINWFDPAAKDLVNQVWLNKGELPLPRHKDGSPYRRYDANHDGRVNIEDYLHDPRVSDSNKNGYLDPEDLIVAFSNHKDSDHNGFVDDISGWDFYDNQNDPATYDSTYHHSNNQMRQAGAEGDNKFDEVGVCPGCMILPIKAGAEALDRSDDLAQAWLYADHMGAKVVISVTADLGYSTYMRQTVEKLWRDGVVMTESSNDFDSLDHQGGMFWPHVLPGNGEVADTTGYNFEQPGGLSNAAINAATTTFSQRSDETSWGTHAMFSAATNGGSTSESTPTVAGTFGLLLSWGRQARKRHLIRSPLTNAEAVQVMADTADDITGNPSAPKPGWSGAPGWDLQYGYGRPNLMRAMTAVAHGNIPPVGWISSPRWYSLYDPTHARRVVISGHVAAPRSTHYTWRLQYGLGARPTNWHPIGKGHGRHPFTGKLGTLRLSRIPKSFWTKAFALSQTKTLETNDEYTVTLRLRIHDAKGRLGQDRRAIAVHHDAALLRHFPLHVKADPASQPALVDLQGRGHLALVFGDADGAVHAIDAKTGRSLPGWPVHTRRTKPHRQYRGVNPGHEPILAPVAVGDLRHSGALDVVATSTTGRTYAWGPHGHLLHGWPKTLDRDAIRPAIPRPKRSYTRLRHLGATACPVLVHLQGKGRALDVVQAGWDGDVHAWTPGGKRLSGWPVKVRAAGLEPPLGEVLINDEKIDTTPAVADLDGDGKPEIVVQSQFDFSRGGDIQPAGFGNTFAFHANGKPVAGWPISVPALVVYYGSAQEFITEGSTAPVAARVSGSSDSVAVSGGIFTPAFLYDGTGNVQATYGPVANPLSEFLEGDLSITDLINGDLPADAPVTFTTTGAFGHFGSSPSLSYAQAGSGGGSVATSLLLNGSGGAIKNYERGYDAATGAPVPGYPQQIQGLDFLGSPAIADVDGDGTPDVIDGADSSALHAFSGAGLAPGFPKFTSGWTVFAPSTGDLLSNGHIDVVTSAREGYVFAWKTKGGPAGNNDWWTYHHDERRTGLYGVDARPPGALRSVRWGASSRFVRWIAPGDDWYAGTVAAYRYRFGRHGRWHRHTSHVPAGKVVRLRLPDGRRVVSIQALDNAGNVGAMVTVHRK